MSRPKEILRCTAVFFLVDPAQLQGLTEAVEWLESLLNGPCEVVAHDGQDVIVEQRQLIDRLGGLKIEIYPNEHPPPHFHVVAPKVYASFAIEDCNLLQGQVSGQDHRKIRLWHATFKPLLIDRWNDTRPTDCKVGTYRERAAEAGR